MRILGLGTHILDCPRVRELIARHAERFLEEVYTPAEAAYCRDRSHSTEYYAAFWATKEAVFRALGLKWKRGLNWKWCANGPSNRRFESPVCWLADSRNAGSPNSMPRSATAGTSPPLP